MINVIKVIVVLSLIFVAAISDYKFRKIPNRLTVPFALIGLGFNALIDFPNGILTGVFGFFVGFLIFLLPYIMKGMGAGDVKLMAAIGAITDWRSVIYVALFTAVLGGFISLISRARAGQVGLTLKRTGRLILFYFFSFMEKITSLPTMNYRKEKYRLKMTDSKVDYIPYAIAIAGGCVVTIVFSRLGLIQGLSI
ncbi:A24 family peptidase [Clostridiaceae bacterium HFYG-1003]|nr:A24 family peptidase [Clostridiaceae bacterium HFYG-1003]